MNLKSTNLKGISRIDSPDRNEHCWLVRATKDSVTYSKSFADKKYGGKEKTMKIAIEYRDKLYKSLNIDPSKPRKRGFRVFPYPFFTKKNNNKTGVVGVYRATKTVEKETPEGKKNILVRDHFVASINVEKYKQVQKFFSVAEHGEEKARKLAIAWRKKMEKEVAGRMISKQAEPKGMKYASGDEVVKSFEPNALAKKTAKPNTTPKKATKRKK
ncbi:MAG: AP2 domain-containing protein [Chloroherpetonaceae bacterium]